MRGDAVVWQREVIAEGGIRDVPAVWGLGSESFRKGRVGGRKGEDEIWKTTWVLGGNG